MRLLATVAGDNEPQSVAQLTAVCGLQSLLRPPERYIGTYQLYTGRPEYVPRTRDRLCERSALGT